MSDPRACWCGNRDLLPFNDDYGRCGVCETLVLRHVGERRLDRVVDDDADFYGHNYWFGHQEAHLGHANLFVRARQDLIERCLFWLRTVVKYQAPSGRSLELGCAHGAFVALLRWAGFDAAGLELSPWIAEFASRAFGVPVHVGPIEDQPLAAGSQQLIVAMDVLEHLEDPLGTIGRCVELLGPSGILLLQTPQYPGGEDHEALVARQAPFLAMLQPQEHVYLFSLASVEQLLRRAGLEHIAFEPAIFAHYDMSVLGGRQPLQPCDPVEVDRILAAQPSGAMVRALLDLDDRGSGLHRQVAEHKAHEELVRRQVERLERDRSERLAVIEQQGAELGRIPGFEADITFLREQVHAAEADRAERLTVIEQQGADLGRIPGLEADVAFLKEQIVASEADRAARLEVIESQGLEVGKIPGLRADIAYLKAQVMQLDAERQRLQELVSSERKVGKMPAPPDAPGDDAPALSKQEAAEGMAALEAEVDRLTAVLAERERDRAAIQGILEARLADLQQAAGLRDALLESQMKHDELAHRLRLLGQSRLYRLLRPLGFFAGVTDAGPRTAQD